MNLQSSLEWFGQNFGRQMRRLAVNVGVPAGIAVLAMVVAAPAASAQAVTRTQLSTSVKSENGAAKTVLTANVSDLTGNSVSEGTVSFVTATGSVGSAFVQNGVATLSVDQLPPGTRSITAVYQGDSAHGNSSASAAVAQADPTSTPSFTLTGPASPPAAIAPGGFATVLLTVTSVNGFSQAVNLSCSGLPAHGACTFNPTPVTPAANKTVTSTMQITTQAESGALHDLPGFGGSRSEIAYAILIPGALALAGMGALRRKNAGSFRVLGIVFLLAAGVLGTGGCAARYKYFHRPPEANGGTLAGTYTIVVAAYSSNGTSVQNATPLNLTLTVN
jgi:hypothetical protein